VTPEPGAKSTAWTSAWFESYNTLPAATNAGGRSAVDDIFTAVDAFVRKTGRAVYMGEFAVINIADANSRERWVRLVRQSAEQRGFGWAYWDDGGMNTAYDVDSGTWKPEVLRALLED
jgi:endoglucanase